MSGQTRSVTLQDDSIVSPSVHDARLIGVTASATHQARILLNLADGKEVSLMLEGVERLRMDNFREGNIVLAISVLRGGAIPPGDVEYAYGLEDEEPASVVVSRALERIASLNLVCLKVEPTFGASLTCICAGVTVGTDSD